MSRLNLPALSVALLFIYLGISLQALMRPAVTDKMGPFGYNIQTTSNQKKVVSTLVFNLRVPKHSLNMSIFKVTGCLHPVVPVVSPYFSGTMTLELNVNRLILYYFYWTFTPSIQQLLIQILETFVA